MVLVEKELCEEFGVSRTPMREAIHKLEEMNLVTVIPRYGTHVSSIDINEIRCAFEVKIKLEGLATAAAARRITPDKLKELQYVIDELTEQKNRPPDDHQALISLDARFHEILRQAAQNDILSDFLENLHGRCARLWNSALGSSISVHDVIDQLQGIYHCLKERNAVRASQLSEAHVQHFIDKLRDQLL